MKHNKCMLQQPPRGLDGFSVRASLQNRRKYRRLGLKYCERNNSGSGVINFYICLSRDSPIQRVGN